MATPVVVQRALDLLAAIDELLQNLPMKKRPRETLEDTRSGIHAAYEQLVDLHENVVSLDFAQSSQFTPARDAWEGLGCGHLSTANEDVRRLIEISPTLHAMHRGGVDIRSFYKYDDARRDVAMQLGDSFGAWHFWWDRFKLAVSNNDPRVETCAEEFPQARAFFDAMVQTGVLESYETWVFYHRDRIWDRIKPDKIRYFKQGSQPVGIKFTVAKGGLAGFVNGDWLTAYAYEIIDDHLRRNKMDYEIYSQVRYEAPPAVLRVSGDFDVLARAGGRVLLIECKSGRIRKDRDRDDYAQIAAKADGFRRVLMMTRAEVAEIEFLLVFNPHLSPEAEVCSNFVNTRVRPIRPDEIRGTITDMFVRGVP